MDLMCTPVYFKVFEIASRNDKGHGAFSILICFMIDAIFVQNRLLFPKSPMRSAPSFTKTHVNLTCLLHTSSVFKGVLMPASQ